MRSNLVVLLKSLYYFTIVMLTFFKYAANDTVLVDIIY